MHKYYTFLCCFLSLVRLAAQTTEYELENKYWNYRDRLIKNFVQIGNPLVVLGNSQPKLSM